MPRLTLVPLPGHPATSTGALVVEAADGERVLDAASRGGFLIATRCGGIADCRTCRVQLAEGELSGIEELERATLEEIAAPAGTRLACQALVEGDAMVLVPDPATMEDE